MCILELQFTTHISVLPPSPPSSHLLVALLPRPYGLVANPCEGDAEVGAEAGVEVLWLQLLGLAGQAVVAHAQHLWGW